MKIIVDKIPCSCDECIFMKYDNLYRYCRAIDNTVEQIDEFGHRLYGYRDKDCPLEEFETMLNNTIYQGAYYYVNQL